VIGDRREYDVKLITRLTFLILFMLVLPASTFAVDGNPVLEPLSPGLISDLSDATLAPEDYLMAWDSSDNSTLKKVSASITEATLYTLLSDVSQFYESGDNITTHYGTTYPTTCDPGQLFVDTDYDTDGGFCFGTSANTWKCIAGGTSSGDKIEEDDSSVEVIDDNATMQANITVNGDLRGRFDADGLEINGTISADSVDVDASANPRVRFLDSDCLGTDKFVGSIDMQATTLTDGAEDADIYIRSQEGGANTTQAQFDESEGIWEFHGNFIELPNGTADVALPQVGAIHLNETDEQLSVHSGSNGEISGETAISLIEHQSWSFDPDAVCDGAVDRLFLMTVGDDAPEGIIIDEWKVSFEADPTTEADLDLKYADAFIGVANAAVIDVLDTTTGASTEDTDANINSGAAVANGKVLYLEFGTAYTEATHQIIFEMWYHAEED
jgi:hypothetical protein